MEPGGPAGFAYPDLNTTYFASGGAEANESAFKTVRYYWKRVGKPDKVKVIARERAYHGVTLAAMSAPSASAEAASYIDALATGMPVSREMWV